MTESCKRCGRCCKKELCQIGELVFGAIEPPCPAIVKKGSLFACSFVLVESECFLEPLLAEALGIGKGCTTEDIAHLDSIKHEDIKQRLFAEAKEPDQNYR